MYIWFKSGLPWSKMGVILEFEDKEDLYWMYDKCNDVPSGEYTLPYKAWIANLPGVDENPSIKKILPDHAVPVGVVRLSAVGMTCRRLLAGEGTNAWKALAVSGDNLLYQIQTGIYICNRYKDVL